MERTEALPPLTILQYVALIHEISYSKVCRDVGLTPQQFNDWVKKRRPVPKERLHALEVYFQVDAELLVDENQYLRALTPEAKIDVQILFLNRKLEQAVKGQETKPYRDKLGRLLKEKAQQAQMSRFAAILDSEDAQLQQLCSAFLDRIEQGDAEAVARILTDQMSSQ